MENLPKRKRTTGKEQYYTLPPIVDLCLDTLFPYIGKSPDFLEPAAGAGAFIEGLLRRGVSPEKVQAYDIEPFHPLVSLTPDFLQEPMTYSEGRVIVSNPPFGRANSLSVKFFNRCAQLGDTIGFLVPRAWRKWSVQDRLDLNFHLVVDMPMPPIAFCDKEGNPYLGSKLQTIFQVWERKFPARTLTSVPDRDYIRKVSPQDADVSLTVFGRGCGKLKEDFPRVPNTTQMFLKVSNPQVIKALKQIDFSVFYNNVSYTEALSIKEIRFLLNDYFDEHQVQRN